MLEEELQALAIHCGILDGTYWSKEPVRKARGTRAGKKKGSRMKGGGETCLGPWV